MDRRVKPGGDETRHDGTSNKTSRDKRGRHSKNQLGERFAMRLRTVMLGAIVLVGSFAGATVVMNALWPVAPQQARPALVAMPRHCSR
jgi:hypothetical protein